MTGLAVVCGLKAEARIARGSDAGPGLTVVAGGGDQRRILAELDARQPTSVLSFGVAGGLAPGLAPGDLRVAKAVVGPDGRRLPVDSAWSERLADILGAARAVVAGVDAPLADVAGKAALRHATGAELVDMESHVAAHWAAGAGVPFAAVRVVTDPADRSLPHAAGVGMRPDGRVDFAAIFASLARNPGQIPALVRTGLDARAAFATLLRCRERLGPRFALLDFAEPLLHVP